RPLLGQGVDVGGGRRADDVRVAVILLDDDHHVGRRGHPRSRGRGVGGGRFAGPIVGGDAEGVAGSRRGARPGVGGHVRAECGDRGEVGAVGGLVDLEARLVRGVVRPAQTDLAVADGGGRQAARPGRRPRGGRRGGGGGGGGR